MVSTDLASRLTRAATHLERGAGIYDQAAAIEVPDWLFRGRAVKRMTEGFTIATAEARRGLAELEAIGAPVRDALEALSTKVGYLDPANGLQLPGAMTHLNMRQMPAEIRHQARALRLAAELDGTAEPAAIQAAMRAELQDLVSRPVEQLTKQDLDRIATISMLPEHLRPQLPATINPHTPLGRLSLYEWPLEHSRSHVRAELDNVRLDGVARALADDPAITREALDSELRAIIALPDAQVTPELAERVSVIERVAGQKRPALLDAPRPRQHIALRHMSAWRYTPTSESASRATFDSLRRAVLHEELLAQPNLTREQVADDLMRIVAKPDHALTQDDLVRASTLAGLPEHLRPSLPAMDEWAGLGRPDNAVLRPTYDKAIRTFSDVRTHLAERDPEGMAQVLVEHHGKGGAIDLELLAGLAKREGLLERVGFDADALHRQSIATLETINGSQRSADLASSLRLARNVVERHPAGEPAIRTLRDEAVELADRNLARMAGERTDTYGRHPDYAEVGRFASIANLLHELRLSADDAAKPAGDTLAW